MVLKGRGSFSTVNHVSQMKLTLFLYSIFTPILENNLPTSMSHYVLLSDMLVLVWTWSSASLELICSFPFVLESVHMSIPNQLISVFYHGSHWSGMEQGESLFLLFIIQEDKICSSYLEE